MHRHRKVIFSITWSGHPHSDPLGVFPQRFGNLFANLVLLVRVQGPVAALLGRAAEAGVGFFDLVEALVHAQIVTNGVFPAGWSVPEVGKVVSRNEKKTCFFISA